MNIEMTSNKPYLVSAYYDWINDNGLTSYVLVDAHYPGVLVPQAFVTDGQIVLNISMTAVNGLALGKEVIEFHARFSGILEHIVIPIGAIGAIYAKENGAGTSLPVEYPPESKEDEYPAESLVATKDEVEAEPAQKPAKKGKPTLTVVK